MLRISCVFWTCRSFPMANTAQINAGDRFKEENRHKNCQNEKFVLLQEPKISMAQWWGGTSCFGAVKMTSCQISDLDPTGSLARLARLQHRAFDVLKLMSSYRSRYAVVIRHCIARSFLVLENTKRLPFTTTVATLAAISFAVEGIFLLFLRRL